MLYTKCMYRHISTFSLYTLYRAEENGGMGGSNFRQLFKMSVQDQNITDQITGVCLTPRYNPHLHSNRPFRAYLYSAPMTRRATSFIPWAHTANCRNHKCCSWHVGQGGGVRWYLDFNVLPVAKGHLRSNPTFSILLHLFNFKHKSPITSQKLVHSSEHNTDNIKRKRHPSSNHCHNWLHHRSPTNYQLPEHFQSFVLK